MQPKHSECAKRRNFLQDLNVRWRCEKSKPSEHGVSSPESIEKTNCESHSTRTQYSGVGWSGVSKEYDFLLQIFFVLQTPGTNLSQLGRDFFTGKQKVQEEELWMRENVEKHG